MKALLLCAAIAIAAAGCDDDLDSSLLLPDLMPPADLAPPPDLATTDSARPTDAIVTPAIWWPPAP